LVNFARKKGKLVNIPIHAHGSRCTDMKCGNAPHFLWATRGFTSICWLYDKDNFLPLHFLCKVKQPPFRPRSGLTTMELNLIWEVCCYCWIGEITFDFSMFFSPFFLARGGEEEKTWWRVDCISMKSRATGKLVPSDLSFFTFLRKKGFEKIKLSWGILQVVTLPCYTAGGEGLRCLLPRGIETISYLYPHQES